MFNFCCEKKIFRRFSRWKKSFVFLFIFVKCRAYDEGLVGGQLCPELCTTKTVQIESCLKYDRNSKSRVKAKNSNRKENLFDVFLKLFDLNEENELIRCYFIDKFNETDLYSYPNENLTLEEFSQTIRIYLKVFLFLLVSSRFESEFDLFFGSFRLEISSRKWFRRIYSTFTRFCWF